ncbi:hypothetical protein EUGRSUZ_B02474 [Eucalyptus grandis]|uniref:Uncharacterized protein n=2 Tax=Eucalyptus grandis TaxID=71139 RepID=A0ACC3LTT0_EUCGR|nr:hypothetical protein EUGRSUZ_B02474 [Eucalyptus grandis]
MSQVCQPTRSNVTLIIRCTCASGSDRFVMFTKESFHIRTGFSRKLNVGLFCRRSCSMWYSRANEIRPPAPFLLCSKPSFCMSCPEYAATSSVSRQMATQRHDS